MTGRLDSPESIHKVRLRAQLEILRAVSEEYETHLRMLQLATAEGSLTLEDVGTTKEEVAELCRKGALKAAQLWYGLLKKGQVDYETTVDYMRGELTKGGWSLADIPTTEEELAHCRVACF